MTSKAVFISYASNDAAAALRICASLRAAGIKVWLDQSELRGGDAWDQQIRKQIQECALFIPVISAHSDARSEGYFRREWRLAVERTHDIADDAPFLVPVVIDDTPERTARVPEGFRRVQWTRLIAGDVPPAFVERVGRLLSAVEIVESPVAAGLLPKAASAHPGTDGQRRPPRWRLPLLVLAAAAALGFGYFAVTHWPATQQAAADKQDTESAAQTVSAGGGATPQPSIAVLPFADMSENRDQEYFADGMAEEILDLLAKLPQLRVIGRTSSFQFKSRSEDLRTIGEKLGAAFLVEGSVRKSGSRIRVTAQLIDAGTGARLWAESFDREFGDVLNLQDEIASGIARALQLAVVTEDARPQRPLRSSESYTHYLRGRAALDRGDEASSREAVDELEHALALDPGFTRAAEALVLARLTRLGYAGVSAKVGWPAIAAAAQRALQLDPDSALVHAILGLKYATYEYNWPAAEAELRRALALNSRDPVALYHLSWLAFDLGMHDEALRLQNLSISIDPLSPDALYNGAIINYLVGNFDAAERSLRAALRMSPTSTGLHWYLGLILLQRGDDEGALREMLAEPDDVRDIGLALAYHALGRKAESDAALARATDIFGAVTPMHVAIVHAYRGDLDEAFRWLEKAIDERDLVVGHKLRDEPKLEPLRSDPRYKALLRKINRPAPNP